VGKKILTIEGIFKFILWNIRIGVNEWIVMNPKKSGASK
jgi:hypothetical protein